ncbi:glycosyltransferase [Flavobacteriales bacterium]|nr:glycosyltransferase [Flavobacteriales bacterium]
MRASICIPLYNASPWIAQTLHSVVHQISTEDEIILIDDNSTDDSAQIAIDVLNSENIQFTLAKNIRKGACAARNQALQTSEGEFIQWLDADDVLGAHKLSLAIRHLERHPTQLHACCWRSIHGDFENRMFSDDVNWSIIPEFSRPAEWLARDTFMGLHCYAGHRKLFEQAGPWDESLTINQDGEYFSRVVAKSEGVRFTRETEVFYRRSSEGSVSRFSPDKADSLYRSTESMVRTALDLEDSDRIQQMAANRWQHFIYTVYPSRSDLVAKAKNHLRHLPRPNISNPNAVSPLSKAVSSTLGWKTLTHARLLRAKLLSR